MFSWPLCYLLTNDLLEQLNHTTVRAKRPWKHRTTQRESGKFSDDPGRLGEKSDGIQKKHREKEESSGKSRWTPEKRGALATPEKRGELRKSLVFFRKFQEKEKTSKKAGEHQKREELFSGTGKTWRASGKSGKAKEKSGVSFPTPEKGEELQKKLVNTGRRRSSGTTPRKRWALPEKLVKSEKTPEKDGETPGKRGEPLFYAMVCTRFTHCLFYLL